VPSTGASALSSTIELADVDMPGLRDPRSNCVDVEEEEGNTRFRFCEELTPAVQQIHDQARQHWVRGRQKNDRSSQLTVDVEVRQHIELTSSADVRAAGQCV
jgi:hypothetical protein